MRFCCQKFIDLLLSDWIWNLQCCVFWIWITYITVLFVHITWSLKIRTNQNKINLFWKCILLRMIHLVFFAIIIFNQTVFWCSIRLLSVWCMLDFSNQFFHLNSSHYYHLWACIHCATHISHAPFFFPFSVIHFTQLQISIQKKCHHSLL